MNINFVGRRKLFGGISIALVLASVASLAVFGLQLGLDFSGGVLIELRFDSAVTTTAIKDILISGGVDSPVVQFFGSNQDILIRLQQNADGTLADQVFGMIQANIDHVELRKVEFVGAQVGEELRDQGGLGLLVALAIVLVYVAFRFQLKFAIGSVIALAHDVLIILGVFSVFGIEFDLSVLAALLAIIGYSLNDSIVISDRIRDTFFKRRLKTLDTIVNTSLNEVFGRTIITSLTTLFVITALLVFGGEAVRSFALALCIGVIVGTYSSIYVVCNILFVLLLKPEDMIIDEDQSNKEVI